MDCYLHLILAGHYKEESHAVIISKEFRACKRSAPASYQATRQSGGCDLGPRQGQARLSEVCCIKEPDDAQYRDLRGLTRAFQIRFAKKCGF